MIGLLPNIMADAAQSQGISALGLDPWGFLAQAVTFLAFWWIVKRFALEKVIAILEQRRQTIDKGVRLGIEMEQEKSRLDDQVEEALHKARQEADKILAEGQEEARELIRQAEEAASKKAEIIIDEAHAQLAHDIKRAEAALKREMVELVGEATSVLINEKVDAKKDAKLIERVLEEAHS